MAFANQIEDAKQSYLSNFRMTAKQWFSLKSSDLTRAPCSMLSKTPVLLEPSLESWGLFALFALQFGFAFFRLACIGVAVLLIGIE